MDIQATLASIMTKKLFTVAPNDSLEKVKEIFDTHKIHHLPVVRYKTLLGIISNRDLLYFLKGFSRDKVDEVINHTRLKHYDAKDIMTTKLATLDSSDKILTALKVFKENLFHAIPIMEEDEIVGIVTTYDIIKALEAETVF